MMETTRRGFFGLLAAAAAATAVKPASAAPPSGEFAKGGTVTITDFKLEVPECVIDLRATEQIEMRRNPQPYYLRLTNAISYSIETNSDRMERLDFVDDPRDVRNFFPQINETTAQIRLHYDEELATVLRGACLNAERFPIAFPIQEDDKVFVCGEWIVESWQYAG